MYLLRTRSSSVRLIGLTSRYALQVQRRWFSARPSASISTAVASDLETDATNSSLSLLLRNCFTKLDDGSRNASESSNFIAYLAFVSPAFSSSDLLDFPRQFWQVAGKKQNANAMIGCVVDSVGGYSSRTPSVGIARVSSPQQLTAFEWDLGQHSSHSGPASVGRWINKEAIQRRMADKQRFNLQDFESVTKAASALSSSSLSVPEISPATDIGAVLTISGSIQPAALNTLAQQAPSCSLLANLTASATPFVTGLPSTIFINDRIASSGLVGLAIPSTANASEQSRASIHHPHLVPFDLTATVSSAKGNVILELSPRGAFDSIVSRIKQVESNGIKHTGTLYARFLDSDQGYDGQVYRITSGNPVRGQMSLDTVSDIPAGSNIELLLHAEKPVENSIERDTRDQIDLYCGNGSANPQSSKTLAIATEGGFAIQTKSSARPHEVKVPGSFATLLIA